jgi:putative transposase
MKAYSLDLRQKIVDAYAEGQISQRQLAKQFRVTLRGRSVESRYKTSYFRRHFNGQVRLGGNHSSSE